MEENRDNQPLDEGKDPLFDEGIDSVSAEGASLPINLTCQLNDRELISCFLKNDLQLFLRLWQPHLRKLN
jgi:hypothetical protein